MSLCMAPPLRDVGVSVGMVTPNKQAGGNKQINCVPKYGGRFPTLAAMDMMTCQRLDSTDAYSF